MWRPIEVGSVVRIESKQALETAYDLLLIGSFIGLIVYNLLVWRSAGKRSRAPLFLATLFGVLAVRIAMMGQMMVTRLFPEFPWGVQLRIEYLTAHFALLALTLILHAIYPRVINRWIIGGTVVLTGINTLSVLIMPVLVYSRLVQIYVYAMIAVLALELILLLTALFRGRRETWAGVFAVAITFLITLGETIHYQGWILSRDFAPFGFVISLLTDGSLNQSTIYLISAGINLILVFVVANFLAVRGSRSLLVIEEREGNGRPPAADLAGTRTVGDAASREPGDVAPRTERLQADYGITRREGQIAALVARGLSNKEIAAKLHVSEATVKTHMYRILRKVGVGNRTELSRWYYSQPVA
jgi:DNA-binding CsgD family transcriptional regulator